MSMKNIIKKILPVKYKEKIKNYLKLELFGTHNLSVSEKKKITVTFNPKLKAGIYNLNLGARCAKGMLEYFSFEATIEIIPKQEKAEEWNKRSEGLLITDSYWEIYKEIP